MTTFDPSLAQAMIAPCANINGASGIGPLTPPAIPGQWQCIYNQSLPTAATPGTNPSDPNDFISTTFQTPESTGAAEGANMHNPIPHTQDQPHHRAVSTSFRLVATALAFVVPALGLTACDDKGSADLICRTDRTYEVSNFGYFNQTGLPIGAVIAVNNKDPKNPRASNPITLDPNTFTTSTGSQSDRDVSWTSAMEVKLEGNTQKLYDGLTEDAKLSVMSAFKGLFTVDVKGAQRVAMTDVFAAANANSSLVSALQSAPPTMEYFLVYAVIQADSYDLVVQNKATAKGSGSKYVVNSKDLGIPSSSGSLDITIDVDCDGKFKANGDGFDAFIKLEPLAWSAASSTITTNPDAQVDWSRIDMSQAR